MARQSISPKVPEIKIEQHFYFKKPFVTPNFCKQNLSQINRFEIMNYFNFKIAQFWDNLELDHGLKPEQFWK